MAKRRRGRKAEFRPTIWELGNALGAKFKEILRELDPLPTECGK